MLEFTEGQTIKPHVELHILRARSGKLKVVARGEFDGLPETDAEFRRRIRIAAANLDSKAAKADTETTT